VLDPGRKKCQSFLFAARKKVGLFSPKIKIGYLGGGQLAQMLAESAHHLGLEPHVLSLREDSPAAQNTRHWHQGSLENQQDLVSFLQSVDVATFESEFMNAEKLQAAQQHAGTPIYPTPQLMGRLQDRKTQKELLDEMHLPTATWATVDTKEDVEAFVQHRPLPVVFKQRTFGYDGYGTFIVHNTKQLAEFLQSDFKPGHFIVEKLIRFKRECAVIVARSADGSFTHLPFVESRQKEARCDWVKGPWKSQSTDSMIKKLRRFLKKIDYVGVMGVEFFQTSKGLVINEIAPRVHNTGHYSQEIQGPSQFDLHNMCLLGQKLPKDIKVKGGFAMVNLIGQGGAVKLQALPGLHWYGKTDNRKGRKMGHLNKVASSANKALELALKKRKGLQL
jgi:5-(carboxyamino)imidazole ribonucleotide synthase